MVYIIMFICSIVNVIMYKKYYIILLIGISTYLVNWLVYAYLSIDINVLLMRFRYLMYMIFFVKFAFEGIVYNNDNN